MDEPLEPTRDPTRPNLVVASRDFDAAIFDLDGVVTRTAQLHAKAWKATFDAYLQWRSGNDYKPFDIESDYRAYVDGKPRYDGVRSFLSSRNITLPEGSPDDAPGFDTVCAIGNKKNAHFVDLLESGPVDVFQPSVRFIEAARAAGLKTAVVSSSKNCKQVLEAAELSDLFDTRVDGRDLEELDLKGKPAPDLFLEAARRLGAVPERCIAVEDAVSGIQAIRRGGFRFAVGIGTGEHEQTLRGTGAHHVVSDLGQLALCGPVSHARAAVLWALGCFGQIRNDMVEKPVVLFLDYDGTLTPIVERPEQATLSESMRQLLKRLAKLCPVAVISGRDLRDVQQRVGIPELHYAGSHGFDIRMADGTALQHPKGRDALPALDEAEQRLTAELRNVPGSLVERKRFSVAIHYRQVEKSRHADVMRIVERVATNYSNLRRTSGKAVLELRPAVSWDKGKALQWLSDTLGLPGQTLPFYLGDDTTDEDAFRVLDKGIGVLVSERPGATSAGYYLRDVGEVQVFLSSIADLLEQRAV